MTVSSNVSAPAGLLGLLADRFSPARFASEHEIASADVDLLLHAAGRAPSAGNSQPWAFVVGRRGDAVHDRLVRHLSPGTSRWAPDAALLLANLAHVHVEGTDWEYSEFSRYDLGQALAHLTVQAASMGLAVHQFRGFDRDAVAADFAVPGHWEVTSMAAVGRPHPIDPGLPWPGALSSTSRERHPVEDIVWARADRVTPAVAPTSTG